MKNLCLNRNVLLGLGAVALGVLLFAPGAVGAVLPLLLVAACPLSMLLMMRGMTGSGQSCGTETRGAEEAKRGTELSPQGGSAAP